MKNTTIQQEKDGKFGIIALVLSVFLVAFYFFTSQNEEKSSVVLNESRTNSTIETDSLKRLETVSNSGTNWGMSPFGSGKPLTEEEKPKFKKPNTEWKPRTINGVTYVFGQGNPKEVSMSEDELKKFIENGGREYMTAKAENAMKEFLENPNLINFYEKCQQVMNHDDIEIESWRHISKNLNMEDILYINTENGRKEFNKDKIEGINQTFLEFDNLSLNENDRKWNECLSKNEYKEIFTPLQQKYLEITKQYYAQIN